MKTILRSAVGDRKLYLNLLSYSVNFVLLISTALSLKMSVPRPQVQNRSLYHSTRHAGLRSYLGKQNALPVEETRNDGPCLEGHTRRREGLAQIKF